MDYPTPEEAVEIRQQRFEKRDQDNFEYFRGEIIKQMNKGYNSLYVCNRQDGIPTSDKVIKQLVDDVEANGYYTKYSGGNLYWSDKPFPFDWLQCIGRVFTVLSGE